MASIRQYTDNYIENTEKVIAKVFRTPGSGFPVSVFLKTNADLDPLIADVDDQYPEVMFGGQLSTIDYDLFPPGATRQSVEADIALLKAQLAQNNDPAIQQEIDDKEGLLGALINFISFSADLALFSTEFNNAMVIQYLANPNDPVARARLDRAVQSALYLFPLINGEHVPVRWRFPEREGDFLVNDGERQKAGFARIQTPLGNDFIRTDLSREAITGQVLGLVRLYEAHPDQQIKDRIKACINDVINNLQQHSFRQHIDPYGFVTDFSVVTAARRLLPRPLSALIPNSDQLDALKGGDKLMVYAMLRGAATVDSNRWNAVANRYFTDFESAFSNTSVGLYHRFYQVAKSKTKKYSLIGGAAGAVGAIAGVALGGILSVIGLPFLALSLLGVLAAVGGAVYILMNRKVEIERFNSLYETIQLEQRLNHFLLEFEIQSHHNALQLWQKKIGQCFILQRKKMDALSTAYFVDSPGGKKFLAEDLVKLDQQIAILRRQLRKAKKRWCSLLGSKSKRKKYKRAARMYESLKIYRKYVWLTKTGAHVEAPKNIILAHYAHTYSREPADHNAGGSLGTVLEKIRHINDDLASTGSIQLGASDIGFQNFDSVATPGYLRTVTALTDKGLDEVQYRFPPSSFLWPSRRSVTKHPLFRFGSQSGHIFYQPGEALFSYFLLKRNGIPI